MLTEWKTKVISLSKSSWLSNRRVMAVGSSVLVFYIWYQILAFENYYESHMHMRILPASDSRRIPAKSRDSVKMDRRPNKDTEVSLPIDGRHELTKFPSKPSNKRPRMKSQPSSDTVVIGGVGDQNRCQKKRNTVFLKTHGTGSETASQLFARFGDLNNLNPALPRFSHRDVNYPNRMNATFFLKPPSRERFNTFFLEAVYNRSFLEQIMTPQAKYITVIREPFSQFRSAFDHLKVADTLDLAGSPSPLHTFIENPESVPWQKEFPFLKNFMTFDLGLPKSAADDMTAVGRYLNSLDRDFDLVMIFEYFEESLILLRRLLCWHMKDILHVPLEDPLKYRSSKITANTKELYAKFSPVDLMLYNYFNETFWRRVSNEDDFEREVAYFRFINSQFVEFCKKPDSQNRVFVVGESDWSSGFAIEETFCSKARMAFSDYVRKLKEKIYSAKRRKSKPKLKGQVLTPK